MWPLFLMGKDLGYKQQQLSATKHQKSSPTTQNLDTVADERRKLHLVWQGRRIKQVQKRSLTAVLYSRPGTRALWRGGQDVQKIIKNHHRQNDAPSYAIRTSQKGTYVFTYSYVFYRWLYVPYILVDIFAAIVYGAWYQVVRDCNLSGACGIGAHITKKLHELKTALDASRGGWRCKQGASTDAANIEIGCTLVAFEGQTSMHRQIHQYTNTPTHKRRNHNFIELSHAVGKRSENFLTRTCTQATIVRSDV